MVRRLHLHGRRHDLPVCGHGDRHLLRLLVGWSIADPVCTSLAADTVEMAVAARSGRVNGGVFHTDRGSHYSSRACAEACSSAGVRRRMSAVGSSADKALAA
ncbi:DDE-type integrase/transposase/recombinase [Streptomyces anulatus]|uniref:DDE-type integrase/transposase/recombinase n=1 Tax=Streptomyces anulatus TaxID=1892 RepID=UPI00368B9FF7